MYSVLFQVWNVKSTTSDNVVFRLINYAYNGHKKAGSVFRDATFNVHYDSGTTPPQITRVTFNGDIVCATT
jgi:hypothetical protein